MTSWRFFPDWRIPSVFPLAHPRQPGDPPCPWLGQTDLGIGPVRRLRCILSGKEPTSRYLKGQTPMKAWTGSIALGVMAAILTLAGCSEDTPGDVASVTEPAPGDPAIYAPDGWPLQIGDVISVNRRQELDRQYGRFANLNHVQVVGDDVYSSRFRWLDGPPGDDGWPPYQYEGHFLQLANPVCNPRGRSGEPEKLLGKVRYREPLHHEAALIESALTGVPMSEIFPCWYHGCDGVPMSELPCWTRNRCEPIPVSELHAFRQRWDGVIERPR